MRTAYALVFALVLTGCGQAGAAATSSAAPLGKPDPFSPTDAALLNKVPLQHAEAAGRLDSTAMIEALEAGGIPRARIVRALMLRAAATPILECGVPYVHVDLVDASVGRRMLELGLFEPGPRLVTTLYS